MGRHERRTEIARFRREASRHNLTTFLVAADVNLSRWPLLSSGVAYWRSMIAIRKPFCPSCRRNYSSDAREGAFLLSRPQDVPSAVTVSCFCDRCFDTLTLPEVERHCTRILRVIIPNGVLEPLPARDMVVDRFKEEARPCQRP